MRGVRFSEMPGPVERFPAEAQVCDLLRNISHSASQESCDRGAMCSGSEAARLFEHWDCMLYPVLICRECCLQGCVVGTTPEFFNSA